MDNLLVFNDSHKSDGFEQTINLANKLLEKHEVRIKTQFIEDFVGNDGEFAWYVSVVPDDLPVSRREG